MDEPGKRRWSLAPRHFALLANYRVYDVEAAAASQESDTWTLPRGDLQPGDLVAIWRTSGPDRKRGIVAFGVVTCSPVLMPETEESRRFWREAPSSEPKRRVTFDYWMPPNLPLWLDEDNTGVLAQLTVSRAQGNKLYKVPDALWTRLLELAGATPGAPLPPATAEPPTPAAARVPVEDAAERVLEHLRAYGSLTEAQVTRMAGGPRAYRKLRRHLDHNGAPLQMESTPRGMLWRIAKEST